MSFGPQIYKIMHTDIPKEIPWNWSRKSHVLFNKEQNNGKEWLLWTCLIFFHTHQHNAFKSVSAADSSQDDTLLPYYPSYPIQLSAWLLTKLIMFAKRISH